MKASLIAAARAQVALSAITGDAVADDVRELARQDLEVAASSRPAAKAPTDEIPGFLAAVLELRRSNGQSTEKASRHKLAADAVALAEVASLTAISSDLDTASTFFADPWPAKHA